MSREWRMYVRDMVECCNRITAYSQGLTKLVFEHHGLAYDAIVRNIELLGEAARHIPPEIRDKAPVIEWQKIIALRNILIHGYFGIDDDILWDVVQNKIGPLHAALVILERDAP